MDLQLKRDLPGKGDVMRPHDEDRTARIEAAAQIVFDQRMASLAWVNDAQAAFTTSEHDAITQAIVDGNDMEVGRLMRHAVIRVIKRDSELEAQKNYREILRAEAREAA